ncbi:two-component system OmpR family sensor kinase [Kitasatospora gansuensis]|uniref:histidine kinase n=1 Tax=Kitasatospora gansuensis TaxID=258050 RepID=A0A7W7WI84_9ACTN|nr:HAMP domain-containing sensor histidine kinase [Kitasatospora gansuensis]MBB4947953.1 two-component system OmpR family sensor kinase [Kitasatospora gansuensis]
MISRLSLRTRLLLLTLLLVTTGLAASDVFVLATVRGNLVDRADEQLQRFADPISHRDPERTIEARQLNQAAGRRIAPALPSQYLVQFLGANGGVEQVLREPMSDADPGPKLTGLGPLNRPFDAPGEHPGHRWRVLVLPIAKSTPATPQYVLTAISLDDVDSTVSRLQTSFLAIGGVVLLLIAALGTFAVRAGLRPLARIEQDAELIATGGLSHRITQPPTTTEVGRLSAALNSMLGQLEAAFAARARSEARMRRFVADASHELRTPLAGIRGFAELHRMGALQDVDRAMDRIESEAIRLGTLVEDLLTLARLDEERPLDLAPMDLRTLAADALHDLTALDPGRPVSLTGPAGTGAPQPAPVLGDEARLRQVVTNLVGNAAKHTPPGTPVRIGVGRQGTYCLLEVADSGPGLTPDQSAQIFDRFYRVDLSRSRQDGGGAGLGLAIAHALTSAHHGSLTVESGAGEGAVFQLRLPPA